MGGSVYFAYLLTRAIRVGRRIVIARDRIQVVEGRGAFATVQIQVPYENIASLKAEMIGLGMSHLRIYLHTADHPSTVLPDSKIETDHRAKSCYYELSGSYVEPMDRILAAIKEAQQKWQEPAEVPSHSLSRPKATRSSEPPVLIEAEIVETEEEGAREPKRYKVKRFTLGGRGSSTGLLAAAAVGAVTAVILSVVCAFVGSFFWLLLIFPVVHGVLVGIVPGLVGRITKADYPVQLALIGAASGAFSVLGVHYLDYLGSSINPGAPTGGFWEFMRFRAEEGVRIGKVFQGGNRTNLGFTGSVVYWCVELLFTVAAAAGAAQAWVQEPLCRECLAWKKKRELGPYKIDLGTAIKAAAAGCPATMVSPRAGDDTVTIEIFTCPNCAEDGIDVRVFGTRTEKDQTARAASVFVTYPESAQQEFDDLRRACRHKKSKAT
ncbi:hypothetical protein [Gemmata massiliana]|uniref:hypothetical protein n=1 Tax=Gemmata massiliana TaxID=1210884 RepID=UPI0013A69654|nr:hypothetical protein [Gemmata massiliana]